MYRPALIKNKILLYICTAKKLLFGNLNCYFYLNNNNTKLSVAKKKIETFFTGF